MKLLIIDLHGDYGHFKKFYTTSSPLTFSFPPPPTVWGILGAICGVDKQQYLEEFSPPRCRIAIALAAPVKKVRMGINHLNTKGNYWTPVKKKNHEARTQIRMELVKDPVYRVYVHHEDESLFNRLVNFVQGHKTVYSVSLGLSEMLADFKYVGLSRAREREARDPVSLNSVLPVSAMEEYGLEVEDGKKYFKERIPVKMNAERIVEQYQDVIFEARGQSIKATAKKYWETEEGERIVFF